jgi:CubicO group peptidase (beta-lactamase class C family)
MTARPAVKRLLLLIGALLTLSAPAKAAPDPTVGLEAWADQMFEPALATRRFSGAEIVVVKDGQVLLAKGYGAADPATGRPMDPAATQVRIGSATKVFTGTAVAQLLERGAIRSLDDPANRYLKRIKLPDWHGRQITIWDLLTHRAGFEDRAFGLGTSKPIKAPVDAATILREQPKLVRAPGTASVYSNYGLAVLGVLVEDVSGQDIRSYFASHIFQPLGMADSRLDFDLKPGPALARPYGHFPNGERQAALFTPMNPFIAPAGGVSTTGLDMAKFMAAHMAGERGQASILQPATFRLMHARHVANHPAATGLGMVFIEGDWNGSHVFEHGGGWPGFQTVMVMIPDQNVGVFAEIVGEAPQAGLGEQLLSLVAKTRFRRDPNTPVEPGLSSSFVREEALTRFLGAYRPVAAPVSEPASAYAGTYCRLRKVDSTVEKVFNMLGAGYAVWKVAPGPGETLSLNGVGGYRAVAPGVFFNAKATPQRLGDPNATSTIAFTREGGRTTAAVPQLSVDVWERCGELWNLKTIGLMLAVIALVLATGLWAPFWRGSPWAKAARWLPLLQLGLILAIPVGLLSGYAEGDGLMYHLLMGKPGRFVLLAALGNLLALAALLQVIAAVASWRAGWWGVVRRTQFSLIALASILLIAILGWLNLIGINLP